MFAFKTDMVNSLYTVIYEHITLVTFFGKYIVSIGDFNVHIWVKSIIFL